jgi:hypothetical protein
LLVRADAAVLRADIMGALFVTAIYLGRRSTAYFSLLAPVLCLADWPLASVEIARAAAGWFLLL